MRSADDSNWDLPRRVFRMTHGVSLGAAINCEGDSGARRGLTDRRDGIVR